MAVACGGLILNAESSPSKSARERSPAQSSATVQLRTGTGASQVGDAKAGALGNSTNLRAAVDAARVWLDSKQSSTNGHGSADFRISRISSGVGAGQMIVRFDQTQSGVDVVGGQVVLAVNAAGRVVAATA